MSTVKEVLEVIYKESEQAIFSEEQQKNSECLEFLKSINFSVSHLKSIISKEPNDGLKTWNSIVNENPIEEVSVKIFVQSSLVLLCVISKEFLRCSGLSSSAKNSLNSVESCLAKNKEIHYIYVAGERVQIYEKYLAFTLQEERFASIYEQSLEEKFEANLGGQEKRIEKIQADINYGNELLEAIESETGHASLIHGFKEYSKKLNEKKRKLTIETNNIKYLLLLIPATSGFFSLTIDVGYGFYLSAFSAMALLGLLLRVNIRKEDQLSDFS